MKRTFNPLLEQQDDGSLGNGGGAALADPPIESNEPVNADDGGSDSPDPTPAPEPQSTLTREEMLEAVREMAQQQQTAQPQPEPQLTQEQIDQQLERYRPDAQLVNVLLDAEAPMEQKIAALDNLVQGTFRYSSNAANQLVQHHIQQLKQELAPQLQAAGQAQESMHKQQLFTTYPALKGQDELVEIAASQLKAQGARPKSAAEAVKMVGEHALRIAKKVNPNFGSSQQQGNSRMASTSTGGQGGGGSTGPAPKGGRADIW